MEIILSGKKSKYIELYEKISDLINSGELKSNEKLPSKRDLAINLNVSLNTVINAYDLLIDEGYIHYFDYVVFPIGYSDSNCQAFKSAFGK